MLLSDLLRETLDTATLECWQRERTATPVRAFAVRLHAAGCSLRETAAILGLLGVERTHGAVWNWVHRLADSVGDPPSAQPTRVAVDETAVRINGEWSWVYAAIDLDTKLLLDATVFGRRGTDPAAAFLHGLTQKHDCSQAVFLVDSFGYLTALSRLELSGQLDYTDRNHIEKWFHTLKMRIDRFHSSWVGSRRSVRQWLASFVHYYNFQRPHQSLDERTPPEWKEPSARHFFGFGVLFALAALECTAPIFIGITLTALSSGGFTGAATVFSGYAGGMIGMFVVMTGLIALAKEETARQIRSLIPYVERASAVLLIAAGGYMLYYYWQLITL